MITAFIILFFVLAYLLIGCAFFMHEASNLYEEFIQKGFNHEGARDRVKHYAPVLPLVSLWPLKVFYLFFDFTLHISRKTKEYSIEKIIDFKYKKQNDNKTN